MLTHFSINFLQVQFFVILLRLLFPFFPLCRLNDTLFYLVHCVNATRIATTSSIIHFLLRSFLPSQQLTAVDQAQRALKHIYIVNIGILTRALDSIMCLFLARSIYLSMWRLCWCVKWLSRVFPIIFHRFGGLFNFMLFSFPNFSLALEKNTFYHCSTSDYFISVHALFNISDCLCSKLCARYFLCCAVRVLYFIHLFFVLRETKLRSPSQTCIFFGRVCLIMPILSSLSRISERAKCMSDCFRDF